MGTRSESEPVGSRVVRIDGLAKVTGSEKYTSDLHFEDMLYVKILRSPVPHAIVKSVDVSEARAVSGVVDVITRADVPKTVYNSCGEFPREEGTRGKNVADQSIFPEKVQYVGDRIAAVAAESEEIANRAVNLIRVEYEEVPAVFDVEEAMKPGSPLVHDGMESNVVDHKEYNVGDIEKGFSEADFIFENEYSIPYVQHCALETYSCICRYDQGRFTFWSGTQSPFSLRRIVAEILSIPETSIHVLKCPQGGGFGNKLDILEEAICAVFAQRTRRPIKIVYTREEEFYATRHRHKFKIWLKTGVRRDGTFTARQMRAVMTPGAHAPHGPAIMALVGGKFGALYRTPNLKYEGWCVYTNLPTAGPYRGYGNPQATFPVETQMDIIADKLGMDPIALRMKNARVEGDTDFSTGLTIRSCGLTECIELGSKAMKWEDCKRDKTCSYSDVPRRRGIGMARSIHISCVAPHAPELSSCFIKIDGDGAITLITGASEGGNGCLTSLAQVVAATLGVRLEQVNVFHDDTDVVPYDCGSFASRTLFVAGKAAEMAALKAKQELLKRGACYLQTSPNDLDITNGIIWSKSNPGKTVSVARAVSRGLYDIGDAGTVIAAAQYAPKYNGPTFGAEFAQVEVDLQTGKVTLLRFVQVQDVGRAINPTLVEGQLQGAAVQGIGTTLQEETLFDDRGRIRNAGFSDYKVPRFGDVPGIETLFVETIDPEGPFGAKGVGEAGIIPAAAAIANAIYDAVGIMITDLPITAEKLFGLIQARELVGYSNKHTEGEESDC